MANSKFVPALLAASMLAACGGGGSGDQDNRTAFSAQVSFGDSLSDVGSYDVGAVKALAGGKFTINGDSTAVNPALTGKNWTELMAAQFKLPAPCAAQTGLDGDASLGMSVPVVNHRGCFGYAQGGARVTDPIGIGHKLSFSPLGGLTVPVITQIQNHLAASGGRFKGDEIVFVMAGANDALTLLNHFANDATAAAKAAGAAKFGATLVDLLAAGASNPAEAAQAIAMALAAENADPAHTEESLIRAAVVAAASQPGNAGVAAPEVYGPMALQAQADGVAAGVQAAADYAAANGPRQVTAMAATGAELAALVKDQILANGANYVSVNNLPDAASTPFALSLDVATRNLLTAMVMAFNQQLESDLGGESKVLLVNVYEVSRDQAINPAPYGLSNVTQPACDLSRAKNPLESSLGCNASNLMPGDVSHYAFADDIHPTPYNNLLLARFVAKEMIVKGWL